MNLKRLAASQVFGGFAAVFAVITALNYFFPAQANLILGLSLIGYLIYIVYSIRYTQLKFKQEQE